MKYIIAKSLIVFLGTFYLGCAQTAPPAKPTTPPPQKNQPLPIAEASPSSTSTPRAETAKDSEYPKITIASTSPKTVKINHKFEFEQQKYTISLKVNKAILEGARNATKYAISKSGHGDVDWRERFNLAFIEDPAQSDFLDTLHAKLISLSKSLHLDQDRTVELFTAFVQHIEYDTRENVAPKFPIETFAEKRGDCDDKSRLLVALLSRSGFHVATLNFNEENHMAVGIRSNGMEYRGTGYSYIETTSPSLVGFPFRENTNVQLTTTPTPQRIGKGKRQYKAAPQIEFLVATKSRLEEEIQKDQKTLNKMNQKCAAADNKVKEYQKELNKAPNSSETKHNREVNKYNDAVDGYNKLIAKQQKLAKRINQKIDIRNYIAKNAINRHHTYKWVKNKMARQ